MNQEQLERKRTRDRELMRRRRAEAKALGVKLPGDDWAAKNPDRHRENVGRWRAENPERSREVYRTNQATRRSTPWGQINNRIWAVLHCAVRANSSQPGKYTAAIGYLWSDLRAHLERHFQTGMTWENWGDVWEIDHITPVSSFKYTSLEDPLFRQAWRLDNLRPLWREENATKGRRVPVSYGEALYV